MPPVPADAGVGSRLAATEGLAGRECRTVVTGSEANLLGWYLYHQRSFPDEADMMVVADDIWPALKPRPEFIRRKEKDVASYHWDRLIESLSGSGTWTGEGRPDDVEFVLRTMAKETRFARRGLDSGVDEFFLAGRSRARILAVSASDVVYVVAYLGSAGDKETWARELDARCRVARQVAGRGIAVVGIGIGAIGDNVLPILAHYDTSQWSEQDDELAREAGSRMNLFQGVVQRPVSYDEFPDADEE